MLILIYQTSRQQISDDSNIIYYHDPMNPLLLLLRLVIRKTDELNNYKTKRLRNTMKMRHSVLPRIEILSPEFQQVD